jgi:hypothetical protein
LILGAGDLFAQLAQPTSQLVDIGDEERRLLRSVRHLDNILS